MIFCRHIPAEPLARYVDWLWFFQDITPAHRREHVLPDGTFELIIDLRDEPRRLFHRTDAARDKFFRGGWISGTHSRYITIDVRAHASMIGVHFKAGGAAAILGMPADVLRDQVVELDAIWGGDAGDLRERLLEARTPETKFSIFEQFLLRRLRATAADRLAADRVFWARDRFIQNAENANVRSVVDQLGISHKHFIDQFRRHVGLTPKLFCRIQRFQQVLSQLNARRTIEWADVACSCGYFDQAHFVHDFQEFSGLNPTTYASAAPEYSNFVPVDERR
jgi:AraC-like DNA-binding protein